MDISITSHNTCNTYSIYIEICEDLLFVFLMNPQLLSVVTKIPRLARKPATDYKTISGLSVTCPESVAEKPRHQVSLWLTQFRWIVIS